MNAATANVVAAGSGRNERILGLLTNDLQLLACWTVFGEFFTSKLCPAQNHTKGIIDVVSDPSRKPPDGLEPFELLQLLLHSPAFFPLLDLAQFSPNRRQQALQIAFMM